MYKNYKANPEDEVPINQDEESDPKFLYNLQKKCVDIFLATQQQVLKERSPSKWKNQPADEIDFLVTFQTLINRGRYSLLDQLVFSSIYAITAEVALSDELVQCTKNSWAQYK